MFSNVSIAVLLRSPWTWWPMAEVCMDGIRPIPHLEEPEWRRKTEPLRELWKLHLSPPDSTWVSEHCQETLKSLWCLGSTAVLHVFVCLFFYTVLWWFWCSARAENHFLGEWQHEKAVFGLDICMRETCFRVVWLAIVTNGPQISVPYHNKASFLAHITVLWTREEAFLFYVS